MPNNNPPTDWLRVALKLFVGFGIMCVAVGAATLFAHFIALLAGILGGVL